MVGLCHGFRPAPPRALPRLQQLQVTFTHDNDAAPAAAPSIYNHNISIATGQMRGERFIEYADCRIGKDSETITDYVPSSRQNKGIFFFFGDSHLRRKALLFL